MVTMLDWHPWAKKGQMRGFGDIGYYDSNGDWISTGSDPSISPFSMACTCVGGVCAENGNSCASTYPGTTSPNVGSPSNWGNVIAGIFGGATKILGTRYAVPQLNPGQLLQTGPGGTSIMYQGSPGSMGMPSLSNLGGSLTSGSMLPLLLVGGVVLFMMRGK